jgi:hypothetical protein
MRRATKHHRRSLGGRCAAHALSARGFEVSVFETVFRAE